MKKENELVQLTYQELIATRNTANSITRAVDSIIEDFELVNGESALINEVEHATIFGNDDSHFADSFSIRGCVLYKHPREESTFVICRGSMLPTKVSLSCVPAAASFLKSVFSDSSKVTADGLVLQPLTVYVTSKSFLANVCTGTSVSGSLYIPD